jgi:hypothetical protein
VALGHRGDHSEEPAADMAAELSETVAFGKIKLSLVYTSVR